MKTNISSLFGQDLFYFKRLIGIKDINVDYIKRINYLNGYKTLFAPINFLGNKVYYPVYLKFINQRNSISLEVKIPDYFYKELCPSELFKSVIYLSPFILSYKKEINKEEEKILAKQLENSFNPFSTITKSLENIEEINTNYGLDFKPLLFKYYQILEKESKVDLFLQNLGIPNNLNNINETNYISEITSKIKKILKGYKGLEEIKREYNIACLKRKLVILDYIDLINTIFNKSIEEAGHIINNYFNVRPILKSDTLLNYLSGNIVTISENKGKEELKKSLKDILDEL